MCKNRGITPQFKWLPPQPSLASERYVTCVLNFDTGECAYPGRVRDIIE